MRDFTLNQWYTAERLQSFVLKSDEVQKKRRFCYKQLMGFLLTRGKDICALMGIRRTGKTVLMLQAIYDLMTTYHIPAERIAYITIGEKNTLDDMELMHAIDRLAAQDVRYIFVDEISYVHMELEDNTLNLLADRLAKSGVKIVIAGTFSYAIRLLAKETLFDRMQLIDTTYFSFKEAHEVFGQDLDTFLQYGGVINFEESSELLSPADYMDTAIVQNIVKSIFKSDRRYELLMTVPDSMKQGKSEKELQAMVSNLIRITVDTHMKKLVVENLANKSFYKFSDVGRIASAIRSHSEQEALANEALDIINLDKKTYYRILADYIGNSEQIPKETFQAIIRILEEIGIKQDIFRGNDTVSVFIPNYLRYGLCDQIMQAIGDKIREETNQRYDADLAGEILMGSIQEAVCYLDLKAAKTIDFDMYRTSDGSCEADLVIRNKQEGWIDVYEIKHSSQVVYEQAKHLLNRDFIREIEQVFSCNVRNYYVLYNGQDKSVQLKPETVFGELEQKYLKQQKTSQAEKWGSLREQAEGQAWETVNVQYRNTEKFLCGLPLIR
ncbi:MAG: AAA family ATPase [Eubacteriales bacterium]|nr:AAA family ATPase [Eubacteriales bacterium]